MVLEEPHPEETPSGAVSKDEANRHKNMGAYVDILRCDDGRHYVGSARAGLECRVAEHNAGSSG